MKVQDVTTLGIHRLTDHEPFNAIYTTTSDRSTQRFVFRLLADGDEKYADVNNVHMGFKKKQKKKK